jgi:hypothetical protein
MARTPSRTATAYGGGTARHSVDAGRREVKRVGAVRVRGEEAEGKALARGTRSAYEALAARVRVRRDLKPNSHLGAREYMRRVDGAKVTRLTPGALPCCLRGSVLRAREAERSTRARQKSAESTTRHRTARKEEHMESKRSAAFDA